MNAQEIYNTVRDHLLAQNARATDGDTTLPRCLYRTLDGKKCAVGCLIADDHYTDVLEGDTAEGETVQEALRASGIDADEHLELLCELQGVHDCCPDVGLWPQELARVAGEFGLTP